MKFLGNLTKINDSKYLIGFVHNCPFDDKDGMFKTEQELEKEGILFYGDIDTSCPVGLKKNIYINPNTHEIIYEYEDLPPIPPTKDEQMEELINKQNLMQKALDDIILNSMGGI